MYSVHIIPEAAPPKVEVSSLNIQKRNNKIKNLPGETKVLHTFISMILEKILHVIKKLSFLDHVLYQLSK